MAKTAIMVLNDDETYTSLGGCSIVLVDEEYLDQWNNLQDAIDDGKAQVVTHFEEYELE